MPGGADHRFHYSFMFAWSITRRDSEKSFIRTKRSLEP